jgi:hypothetical protein
MDTLRNSEVVNSKLTTVRRPEHFLRDDGGSGVVQGDVYYQME